MDDLGQKTPRTQKSHRRLFPWKRLLLLIGGCFALAVIGGVLFIKFDTEAAANFTDDVLRPWLGDARVIALEKIFFNTSDKINQVKQNIATPTNPFLAHGSEPIPSTNGSASDSSLNLSVVSTTAGVPLDGEGEWRNIPLSLFPNRIVLADTFFRPDPSRAYAFTTVVQMDMSKLRLWSVAGTVEPGGAVGKPGPGVIPNDPRIREALVAAFDGGFQYRDGQYGMIVGKTTYVPLKTDLATIVGHADGRIEIIKYEGQTFGGDVVFVRQNAPMLIENGVKETEDDSNRKLWGRTLTSDIYTWRSGIGMTRNGNLIFAVGNSLVPSTLANALYAAGAVNAMQLDINPNWVRFNIFNNFFNGKYSSVPIMSGIANGSVSYLNGYKKDFFYVTKK